MSFVSKVMWRVLCIAIHSLVLFSQRGDKLLGALRLLMGEITDREMFRYGRK